jgi:hypothetical protein
MFLQPDLIRRTQLGVSVDAMARMRLLTFRQKYSNRMPLWVNHPFCEGVLVSNGEKGPSLT